MMFIKLTMLVAVIRLLIAIEQPMPCAGIYTAAYFFTVLFNPGPFWLKLLSTALAFGLSYLYFWLLDRCDSLSLWWFVTLIVGFGIMLRV